MCPLFDESRFVPSPSAFVHTQCKSPNSEAKPLSALLVLRRGTTGEPKVTNAFCHLVVLVLALLSWMATEGENRIEIKPRGHESEENRAAPFAWIVTQQEK